MNSNARGAASQEGRGDRDPYNVDWGAGHYCIILVPTGVENMAVRPVGAAHVLEGSGGAQTEPLVERVLHA